MSTLLPRIGLGLLELPIAGGVAFAVFLGVYQAGCAFASCVDVSGLPWVLLGAVVGLGAGAACWLFAARLGSRWRARLTLDALALVVGLAAYVVPQVLAEQRAAVQRAGISAANARFAEERLRWIESLRLSAHGPAGTVPPMLSVSDDGMSVVVTNASDRGRTVALARVLADANAPGGWRGCALYGEVHERRYDKVWLAPRASERLQADSRCAEAFAGAPLEYRVGDDSRDEGWWSDSAFSAPAGRATPGALFVVPKRDRNEPATSATRGDLLAPPR